MIEKIANYVSYFVIYNIMSIDRLDNIRIPKDVFLSKTHQQCGDLPPKLLWIVKRSDFVLLFLLTEKLRKKENQNSRHSIRARFFTLETQTAKSENGSEV